MFKKFFGTVGIITALLFAVVCALPVMAQQNQGVKTQQLAPKITVDEKTLDKFISAAKEVEGIKDKYTKKIQSEKDKTKAMKLQQQAQTEINKVLKHYNFDLQTYNSIGSAITQNPQLMKKVQDQLQK
jgi:hypothetical protein